MYQDGKNKERYRRSEQNQCCSHDVYSVRHNTILTANKPIYCIAPLRFIPFYYNLFWVANCVLRDSVVLLCVYVLQFFFCFVFWFNDPILMLDKRSSCCAMTKQGIGLQLRNQKIKSWTTEGLALLKILIMFTIATLI